MRLDKWILVAIGSGFLLLGCDAAKNVGRSPEERINESRPVQAETLEARNRLAATLENDVSRGPDLQRELAARDKVRALTCAKGYTPSAFQSKDSVAQKITDQKCFDDFDRATVEWLKRKKLYWLLSAGPLRAIPPNPVAMFAASAGINSIKFAANAPIAVVTSNKSVEIIDVANGTSIFLDRSLAQAPFPVAIASNGRVFAEGGSTGVRLRDAENGEVLLNLPDHQMFSWLDAETGIAIKRTGSADLIDFADNARPVAVRGIDTSPTRVLRLPARPGDFLLCGYQSILRYTLQRDASGVQAILQDQKIGPPMSWSDNTSEVTIDSNWFVQASNQLWITNLTSLETEQVPLAPFYAGIAAPAQQPDEILLFGSFPSVSDARPILYSISNRTFASVEDPRLTAPPGFTALRTVFIPALGRIAVITGTKAKVIDELQHGPRYGLNAFAELLAEEKRAQQEKNAKLLAEREGFQLARVVDGMPVASSPLLAIASEAQVAAVGVYESASGSHGWGKPSIPGVVTVTLRPSAKPVILVLSSYEPVSWKIVGAGSARLKAVLLSGYSPSTVSGEAGVQVINIGSRYAYDQNRGDWIGLKREVLKRTGKEIESFQGAYSGTSFIVGGK